MTRPSPRRAVHGWIALDKPVGVGSTAALELVKDAIGPKKAGYAGTLDPLASGALAIALGDATKLIPWLARAPRRYRFSVRFGEERTTDDAQGEITRRSDARPTAAEVRASLADFVGDVEQVPPTFAALRVEGERAYHRARRGAPVEHAPRRVLVHGLDLVDGAHATERIDTAVLDLCCGPGTYVRAIARDLGRRLGCGAHVESLRRTEEGPFREADLATLDAVRAAGASGRFQGVVAPLAAAVADLPVLALSAERLGLLARGHPVVLEEHERGVPGDVRVEADGRLVAIAGRDGPTLRTRRILQDPRANP